MARFELNLSIFYTFSLCNFMHIKLPALTPPAKFDMRNLGKITYWNEEKAYGFIIPSSGANRVFVQQLIGRAGWLEDDLHK